MNNHLYKRLTWAEINTTSLAHNVSGIRRLVGSKTQIMMMIKANAYGHGAVGIARAAQKLPVNSLGIVCLYEAEELRAAGITHPLVIMNYIDPDAAIAALDLGCELLVMDHAVAQRIDTYARAHDTIAKIHVKVDTGMHRAGLPPSEALHFIQSLERYKNLQLEGVCTHFADADNSDLSFTNDQIDVFNHFLNEIAKNNIHPSTIHAANSAGIIRIASMSKSPYTLVRPGKIMYGLSPTGRRLAGEFTIPFVPQPVLSLKTQIVQIKQIGIGESVGYGRAFIARRPTRIALLPVGYADGFRRAPFQWPYVLVHGKQAPVIGRISMDQSTIDITDIPETIVNDEVVLIGTQGEETIRAEDVAAWLQTISYEVMSSLAPRVERIYLP